MTLQHVFWERLYVPPAPAKPACEGVAPFVFDLEYGSGVNVIRRDRKAPSSAYAAHIGAALRYCETCPLATRQWCIDAVRPFESGFSGVAGGVAWSNGRRVWDLRRQHALDEGAA